MSSDPTKSSTPVGVAIDASPQERPGVPMEIQPPRPVGAAHWTQPERQRDPGYILKRKGLVELTPVFGTAVPPRGLSGMMRRAAYEIPEHHATHWLVLLLADRIDVLEDRLGRLWPFALPLLAGGFTALALRRRRPSRWFVWNR